MTKRAPRMTKRERKVVKPAAAAGHSHAEHIHCIACGRHLDPSEFDSGQATVLACQHGSQFPSCAACTLTSQRLLAEHDRTNTPVKTAGAWH